MSTSEILHAVPAFGWRSRWDGPLIDCDVHCNVPSTDALLPYLDPLWHQVIAEREWQVPAGLDITYPPNAATTCRTEWRHEDGTVPASNREIVERHVLETCALERAILTCYYAVDSIRNPDWAKALAAAVNDWLIAEWFEQDSRYLGSLVVPARDPLDMAAEIDRVGDHPQFVQVLMPVRSDRPYGQRVWHPVYDAIARHDLVFGLHWGGTTENAPSATGWPTWYVEEYAAELQMYASQIVSMIAEGVFQRFPTIRVSVFDAGFSWLAPWLWRMDKDWKGLRREIPWVSEPPSRIVREHVRFGVAPLDVPTVADLSLALEWLESDELLLYASDYPHDHGDDPELMIDALFDPVRIGRVMAENARDWYRL